MNIENPKLSPSLEYALSLEKRFAEEYLYNKKRENKMRIEYRLLKASEKLKFIEKRINLLNKANSQALKKLETKNIYLEKMMFKKAKINKNPHHGKVYKVDCLTLNK